LNVIKFPTSRLLIPGSSRFPSSRIRCDCRLVCTSRATTVAPREDDSLVLRLISQDCWLSYRTAFSLLLRDVRLMGVPHVRSLRRHRHEAAVQRRGVHVHCPSCLGAAVSVEAAELTCSDRVFTKWTFERANVHHFDGVMSHSFKCSRLSPV
jgi:hypothetical protein